MSAALECFAGLLERAGHRVTWNGGNTAFKFQCPIHEDRTPSCDATTGDRVPVIASCQVCGPAADLPAMLEELGASDADRDVILGGKPSGNGAGPASETVHHDYRDAKGLPVLRIVRELHHDKTVDVKRQYFHAGEWCWPRDLPAGAKPDTRGLLYNAAAVISAVGQGQPVHIAEGERCVDALVGLGLPATCNVGGASQDGHSPKWTTTHAAQLRGTRAVVVWEDNDAPGRAHANAIAASLVALGVPVRVARFPDAAPRYDVRDWLKERAGLPLEQRRAALFELVKKASPWTGTESPAPAESPPADSSRLVQASLSGQAILEHDFPRPASLLGDGIISVGDLGIMFGEAGMAKTYLALLFALAQARAERWMGLETTREPVNVGFIELELHGHTIQDRLRAIGGPIPDTFHLLVRPQLRGAVDLVDADGQPVHLDELRAWITAKQLKVVVIDALARATSCPQVDFSPLLLALDVLRAETSCAILLIHHENARSRATGADSDMDFMRGDSRLRGFPQAVLRVLEHHGTRCLRFVKVSCSATPPPLYFELDENGVPRLTEAPEAASRHKGELNRTRILAAARAACGAQASVPAKDLEARTGLSRSTVHAHLVALVEAGDLVTERRGNTVTYRPSVRASEQGQSDASNGLALQ